MSTGNNACLNHPLGGRLHHYLPFWRKLTRDKFVLDAIQYGIHIPLVGRVRQVKFPHEIKMNEIQCRFVDSKLNELLENRCIVRKSKFDPSGFLSNIFLVPKK